MASDVPVSVADTQTHALRFGNHQSVIDGPLLITQLNGQLTEADAIQFMDFVEAQHERLGNLGMLVLLGQDVSFTPQARQHMGSRTDPNTPGLPMAVLGASLLQRTVLTLVVNAIRLTSSQAIPMRFFSTEQAARDWLTEQLGIRAATLANQGMLR